MDLPGCLYQSRGEGRGRLRAAPAPEADQSPGERFPLLHKAFPLLHKAEHID